MLCRFLALVFFMYLLISAFRTVPSEGWSYSIVRCSKSETFMKPKLIFNLTIFFFFFKVLTSVCKKLCL